MKRIKIVLTVLVISTSLYLLSGLSVKIPQASIGNSSINTKICEDVILMPPPRYIPILG